MKTVHIFSRWLSIFWMIPKLSWFFRMTVNFPDEFKTVRIFQMISNFTDYFKTVLIFPDDCQFSGWVITVRIFQMSANFMDYFKTVLIFPDDCQFSGWVQNCPDFPDDCKFSGLYQNCLDLSRFRVSGISFTLGFFSGIPGYFRVYWIYHMFFGGSEPNSKVLF